MSICLSVIVPTHRRPLALAELLDSLKDQELSGDWEVIVVSNFSDPHTESVVDEYKHKIANLKFRIAGKKGSNLARNIGLELARGEIVYFLDDDCVATHDLLLEQVLRAHLENPHVSVIGGGYITPIGATAIARAYALTCEKWLRRRSSEGGRVVNLVGGNVSYKFSHLRAHNLKFNESIQFGGAETELHLRMFKLDLQFMYLSNLRIEHRAQVDFPGLVKKGFLQGYSAHKRWKNHLFISTQSHGLQSFDSVRPFVRFFENVFYLSYRQGQQFAIWENRDDLLRPRLSFKAMLMYCAHQSRQIFLSLRKGFSNFILRYRFYNKASKYAFTSLPTDRFYFLPVAEGCRFECSYKTQLGCRSHLPQDIDKELSAAKSYGFSKILIPCNVWHVEGAEELAKKIQRCGLQPVALVNGDKSAAIDSSMIRRFFQQGWGVHLLVGTKSPFQNRVIEIFESLKASWSITLLSEADSHSLKKYIQLPERLREQVHFLFSSAGSLWHSKPTGLAMSSFLKKIIRATPSSQRAVLRGAAGNWPSNSHVKNREDLWPHLSESWTFGAAMGSPLFSVIIPSYRSGVHLVQVLKNLLTQETSDYTYEILVVEDGSPEPVLEMIKSELEGKSLSRGVLKYFYWPRTESNRNQFRAGRARNLGVAHAQGKYLCFLDSDTLVRSNYLEDLKRLFESYDVIQARRDALTQDSSQAILSGQSLESHLETYLEDDYWENFKNSENWQSMHCFWKYTCTYGLSVKTEDFKRAGWFAPEFFSYGFEDTDLGYRLAKLNRRFYLNQNSVYHLYPDKKEFNYHFDQQERVKTLTLSSRVFYRLRLDPAIFAEFFPSFYQPLRGEFKETFDRVRYSSIPRIKHMSEASYWKMYSWTMWAALRTRDAYIRVYWSLAPILMKPYYVANYQYRKRILKELEDVPTENL